MIGLIGKAFRELCQSLQFDTDIRQEAPEAIQQFKEYYKKRLEKLKEVDMSAAEQLLEQAFEQLCKAVRNDLLFCLHLAQIAPEVYCIV
jgi:hypothetical protein